MAANPSVAVVTCPSQAEGRFVEGYATQRAELLSWVVRNFGRRDADEIVDETLARAFAALPRLDLDRPLQPWLRVVARRLARELHEARQRCDTWGEVYDELEWLASPDPDPEQHAELVERRTRLARMLAGALMGVSPGQRHVLMMRAVDELPFPVIADRLGSSEAAVRQQLTKACKRLRASLSMQGSWTPALVAPVLTALRGLRWRLRHAAPVRAMAETPSVTIASIVCTGLVCVVGYAGLAHHPASGGAEPATTTALYKHDVVMRASTSAAAATADAPRVASARDVVRRGSATRVTTLPAVRLGHAVSKQPLSPGTQVEVDVTTDLPFAGSVGAHLTVSRSGNGIAPSCAQNAASCN